MTEQSLAHTCWDCTYHIVWIPKYRRKVLYGECREELKGILRQLLDMKKIEIVEGSISKDHIHLSVRIPPKESVSRIMGYLKGKSALMLYDRHPEWRRRTGKDRTFWARGYYVSTVGLNEEVIKKYIQNQEEAKAQGLQVMVRSIPASSIPKTLIFDRREGMMKAVVEKGSGRILGAHLFAARSEELINIVKLAMDVGLGYQVLKNQIFTHPSMAESLNSLFGF